MYMYISFFQSHVSHCCRLSYCEKRISMGRLVRCFMNIIFNALLYCVVKSGPFIIIGTEESTPVADQGGGSQNNPEFWGEKAPHVPYNPTPPSDENTMLHLVSKYIPLAIFGILGLSLWIFLGTAYGRHSREKLNNLML